MTSAPHAVTYRAKPGPWGELICQRSMIEMPPEYLPVRIQKMEPVVWTFEGVSHETLRQLFVKAGCSERQATALLACAQSVPGRKRMVLQPSDQLVFDLEPRTRKTIYAVLARFEQNQPQRDPFHWPAHDEEGLFAGAEVSMAARERFRRLCYVHGNVLLFCDTQVLLRSLPDDAQRTAFLKVLTRRPVLFVSMRVPPGADVEELMRYWGVAGQLRNVAPLIGAAARLPQGRELSLAALLPPDARALLFTFPLPGGGAPANCHWTSFTFFEDDPAPPALDDQLWEQTLQSDYVPAHGPPAYGDILLLSRPDGELLHSCVYLADDIVYTKNGATHWAPWQLSTISDLIEFYSWDLETGKALRTQFYRAKSLRL